MPDASEYIRDAPGRSDRKAFCEVRLNSLEVLADIGALPEEMGVPQPLKIQVVLQVGMPIADGLAHTVDYRDILPIVHELSRQRIVLIETFAMRLASHCLENRCVHEAEVTIEKPKALPTCLVGTKVKLIRRPGMP